MVNEMAELFIKLESIIYHWFPYFARYHTQVKRKPECTVFQNCSQQSNIFINPINHAERLLP